GTLLYGLYTRERFVKGANHVLMHGKWITPFYENRIVAIALEQITQLLMRDAGQEGGIGNLVTIQVQNGEHRSIVAGVQKLVRMPRRRQCPGLGLAVTHHAGNDKIGIVQRGAVGVAKRISQFPALVDRAGNIRGYMAGNSPWKRELAKQGEHSCLVLRHGGIHFAVRSFEPSVGNDGRAAMARAADVDHIDVMSLDGTIQVNIDEVQAGRGTPMAKKPGLDMVDSQRLPEQRVVQKIDLPYRKEVCRPPVSIQ